MSTNDLTPTPDGSETQPLPYNIPPSEPWHVIQSALHQPARTASIPIASRLTPPSSQHGGSDMEEIDVVSHFSTSQTRSGDQTSAHTSTLPTTFTSTHPQSSTRSQPSQAFLSELETERQIRRLASTTADPEPRDGRPGPRAHVDDEQHLRVLEGRILARQRIAARELEEPFIPRIPFTFATEGSGVAVQATPAGSRPARQRMTQIARNMMDRNGNWTAGEASRRAIGRSPVRDANGLGGEAVAIDRGVGSAGLGWSVDGRQLYVGTEKGIFEYAINLMDRKTFPALDMR